MKSPPCVVRISGPVLVCSVQLQTCIYTAALRGTRFSEARLIFMVLIMSMQNMVFAGDDSTAPSRPPSRRGFP